MEGESCSIMSLFLAAIIAIVGLIGYKVVTRKDREALVSVTRGWAREDLPLWVVGHLDAFNAVDFWRQVAPECFAVGEFSGSVINILRSDEPNPHTVISGTVGRIAKATIYLPKNFDEMPSHIRFRTLAHELGHVLGLDHDDFPESVMYPRADAREEPIVTEKDKQLLRIMYGKGY